MNFKGTLRVTGVRSQNPKGFGGAIFTGLLVDQVGDVLDAKQYLVVRGSRAVLADLFVERGQWLHVDGPVVSRRVAVNGFDVTEHQVEAESIEIARPSGEHVVMFLANNPAFEGVGMVKARRLWDRFGEALYGYLDAADADRLAEVLTPDAAQTLAQAWQRLGDSQSLQWLQSHGFDTRLGKKVLAYFGGELREKVEADPYRLLSFCGDWGKVDALATASLGLQPDDPRRRLGALEEACYRLFEAGHTVALTSQLAAVVRKLLGAPSPGQRWRDLMAATLQSGLDNANIVIGQHGLQTLGALIMERQVAVAISQRIVVPSPALLTDGEIDELLTDYDAAHSIELNLEQRHAVAAAAKHGFLCVTGGAGVGKTTVLKAIYEVYDRAGLQVFQIALAGRAAQRMQEATGRPAGTIAGFLNRRSALDLDIPSVLVIDEASMVDIVSMSRLCESLPASVRILLVGDPHQLAPVGPGLVLQALQRVPRVPSVELKAPKRYGSEIAEAANAVRFGKWPGLSQDASAPVAFLNCPADRIVEAVLELVALEPVGTQVLCAVRNGPISVKAINAACQERLTGANPPARLWNQEFDCEEHTGFRLGDTVMCTRNRWVIGLQNGSLGTVVDVEPISSVQSDSRGSDAVVAWIDWDDGLRRPLTVEMLEDVELGFAVTVHKAQGSQWRRVIIPITACKNLDRSLLYTALTRAQAQVILVGDEQAARRAAIAAPRAFDRNVALDMTLRDFLQSHDLAESA